MYDLLDQVCVSKILTSKSCSVDRYALSVLEPYPQTQENRTRNCFENI